MRNIKQHHHQRYRNKHGHNGKIKILRQPVHHGKRRKRRYALQHKGLANVIHATVYLIFAMQNVNKQTNRLKGVEQRHGGQGIPRAG